jgi:hypothetical protein
VQGAVKTLHALAVRYPRLGIDAEKVGIVPVGAASERWMQSTTEQRLLQLPIGVAGQVKVLLVGQALL